MDKEEFSKNEGSRIAYYRLSSPSGSKLWDTHWEQTENKYNRFYDRYKTGYLGHGKLKQILLKHLPRDGNILETGCGLGQYVVALKARGYNCIGLDFALNTINHLRDNFPDLSITAGDICHLNFKDNSIAAYISLGVMEHFQEGPVRPIEEARRVLKNGGTLIASVPQTFKWRARNAASGSTALPDNASFYQYAFSPDEFRNILSKAGFQITAEYGYSLSYAFRVRFKLFRNLFNLIPKLSLIDLLIDRLPYGKNIARMRLYVAHKSNA